MLLPSLTLLLVPLAGPSAPSQEVEWFKSGWYVGSSVGASNANASASDLDHDLAARGHTTRSTLDDTDVGWKVFAGYRFEAPWSIELGYTDLGTIESTVNANPPDLAAFLRDLAEVHPFAGQGFTLAGQYFVIDTDRVEAGLRAGLWRWESDVNATAAGVTGSGVDESGIDPFFGIVLSIDLTRTLQLRTEYEKYYVDGDDVDFLSLGLQIRIF